MRIFIVILVPEEPGLYDTVLLNKLHTSGELGELIHELSVLKTQKTVLMMCF